MISTKLFRSRVHWKLDRPIGALSTYQKRSWRTHSLQRLNRLTEFDRTNRVCCGYMPVACMGVGTPPSSCSSCSWTKMILHLSTYSRPPIFLRSEEHTSA